MGLSLVDIGFAVSVLVVVVVSTGYLIRLCATWQPHGLQPVAELDPEIIELMDRKAHLLADLRDLEMDFQMGKVPEVNYLEDKKRLEPEAVLVLKTLEERGYGADDDDDYLIGEGLDDANAT